ncbi:MAG: energy transducer TonB, partial [Gammaproteobacteria bacterium]|nr:energy transducer TonB [Gammaproteobacteria bacterium]
VAPNKKSEPMIIQAVITTQIVAQSPESAKTEPIKAATLAKQPERIKPKKEQPTPPVRPKAVAAPSAELKGTKASVRKPLQTATRSNSKRLSREYRSTLLRLIERNKYYPLRARRRGMEGKSLVAFTVKRNGEIRNISLSRSSKQQLLDQAAIQTIRRLGKAPPLPRGINRSHWRFVVPISYNIR